MPALSNARTKRLQAIAFKQFIFNLLRGMNNEGHNEDLIEALALFTK
ncbi:hypothetical protein DOQ08_00470 [Marinobacter litoralis]|uniref:Uncharacterized protein n=1 Tax=Marinobacter litoralis TaxID=187981 RepID=A0A3M2RKU6_9GAMM|nr:hypothetical protein DOQ08_00470 [Marinobacter litoralis]